MRRRVLVDYSSRREDIQMTPSERLITRAMQEEVDEGFDDGTAIIRVSNRLGISRDRVSKVWEINLTRQEVNAHE